MTTVSIYYISCFSFLNIVLLTVNFNFIVVMQTEFYVHVLGKKEKPLTQLVKIASSMNVTKFNLLYKKKLQADK